MANSTKLTKSEFDTFVANTKKEIENAYNAFVKADDKFSTINEYQGSYQNAIASSWIGNYSAAVNKLSELYNAINAANSAAANLTYADQSIAASRG